MPQLWLTYQEMADAFGGEANDARTASIARGWKRKRSQDGLSRVQLPDDLMLAYLSEAASHPDVMEAQSTMMVERLRETLTRMVAAPPRAPDIKAA